MNEFSLPVRPTHLKIQTGFIYNWYFFQFIKSFQCNTVPLSALQISYL